MKPAAQSGVSVVIPTFNRRDMVVDAIDSVLTQGSDGLGCEVIVVDDHSTDDTVAALGERYGNDVRVRVLTNTRTKGPAGARNTGILSARFPFVAFLDSDDIYLPGHLEAALDVFVQHPEVGIVFGVMSAERDGEAIVHLTPVFEKNIACAPRVAEDDKSIVMSSGFFAHLLEAGCYFGLPTVVMRTEHSRMLMTESLKSSEDFEFWVRQALSGSVFACLKAPQVCVRRHNENLSSSSVERVTLNHIEACRLTLGRTGVKRLERGILHSRMARAYFDLAWHYRKNGCFQQALLSHWNSMRHGWIWRNFLVMPKLLEVFWNHHE
ncbi:hypothetical protein AGMMS49543_06530 [Betaproteobacteria bacterium]|nr:hypothetical protein AGMMS49543_06530 [Betaproteobacteria bacterium]GHU18047.1 hypothetical protein AGMMS50243_07360 [Betaproteobacteria bacterium]